MVEGRRVLHTNYVHPFFPCLLNTYYMTATDLGTEYALTNIGAYILASALDRESKLGCSVWYHIVVYE